MSTILFAAALAALGHEDYDTRSAASRIVAVLVRREPAAFGPPVSHAAGCSPCPETRSRCSRLCGSYNAHLADTYVPPCSRWCCIDWGLAAAGHCDEWRWWFDRTPCSGGDTCNPGWRRYRSASELYVRNQIRCGKWSREQADAAIRVGWIAEMGYYLQHYPNQVSVVEPWSR